MARKKIIQAITAGAAGVGAVGLLAGVGTVLAARALRNALNSRSLASLGGKVVLITGASRGLGLALAEECARNGCRLAICGRDQPSLTRAESKLRAQGAEVLALRCDISQPNEVEEMVRQVIAHYGRIDLLINNAGIIAVGPLSSHTTKDFQEAMDVMFWGVVHTTLLVVAHMRERRQGQIANITSIGGKMAVPHLLPYSAAKFAATGFSEGITAELANEGIKVTTVIPGLMRTGSHINAFFKGNSRAEYAWFGVSASTPLLAMNASRAASKIVQAIRRGDTELILGLPAKVAALAHGMAPATTVRALGLVNRAMPDSPTPGKDRQRGHESESAPTKSPLTAFGKRAAKRWNQEKIA
jgi:short-subunit dehydrogenase